MDAAAEDCRRQGLTLGRRIGSGGFSTVFSAVDEQCNHENVAVKIMRPPTRPTSALGSDQELVALSELSDLPHVVGMRRHFVCGSSDGDRPVVVMELARGNELFSIVQERRRLPEHHARPIIQQVLATVAAMHKRGWVHRDLKLENVITDTRTSKLTSKIIDFGFAMRQAEAGAHCEGVIGTAHYVAPEVIWHSSYDGRAVDMFAVGVMLYVMLYGRYPFQRGNFGVAPHMRTSEKRAFSAAYSFPHHPDVSDEAKSLMRSLLAAEPADRLTAEDALRDQSWVMHPGYEPAGDPVSDPDSDEEDDDPVPKLQQTPKRNSAGGYRTVRVSATPERSSSMVHAAATPERCSSDDEHWKSAGTSPIADWARSKTQQVHSALSRFF